MNNKNSYFVEPVDQSRFDSFSIHPLRHNYQNHPMLQLDAIESLAHYLMDYEKCRFVSPDISLNSDFYHESKEMSGKTLEQVFEQLEEPKSWIALYNIETHPEYKKFLNEVIEGVRPIIEREQGKILDVQGFMFISAPPAITPFHIDRENNFWIQVHGQKKITVFDSGDRDIVSGEAVEEFILHRGSKGIKFDSSFIEKGHSFVTQPGDGVYFPSTSPHMTESNTDWVEPGNGVSTSLGIVFYTEYMRQQARMHQCNFILRKLGLNPKPVGPYPPINHFKATLGYLFALTRKILKGYEPPPGAM